MCADCFEKVQQQPNNSLGYIFLSSMHYEIKDLDKNMDEFAMASLALHLFYTTIYNRPFFCLYNHFWSGFTTNLITVLVGTQNF